MEFLPFSAFVSCFGNSRKVENSSVSSDTLLELKSGNRIPVSSILVLLMVNSAEKNVVRLNSLMARFGCTKRHVQSYYHK